MTSTPVQDLSVGKVDFIAGHGLFTDAMHAAARCGSGWRTSTGRCAASSSPPTISCCLCATASTSPAPSSASTPLTRSSPRLSWRVAASESLSSPASLTWSWSPTRPPSRSCPGPTRPPGYFRTPTSATASRWSSTPARCCAGSGTRRGSWASSTPPGWRWSSTSSIGSGPGSASTRPAGRPWRPPSAWWPRATSTSPRTAWPRSARSCDPLPDHLEAVGLPMRTIEDEWGPGQTEISFDPQLGLGPADAMILFRTAAKHICHQLGYHATFMCRPLLPNVSSSGWHLHESLQDAKRGGNAFASTDHEALSLTGRQFAAGILDHAIPMTVFSTPTVNGFQRFKPYSFAPTRVNWAVENRGSRLRVQGQPGDQGSHLEYRLGELAADRYLYMAANIAAGLDGIRRQLTRPRWCRPPPIRRRA